MRPPREAAPVIGFAATGVGSMPGMNADEATRVIAGEFTDLPHVVELPARGPGADMIGRTMSMLAELAPEFSVETTPQGWRFSDAPGRVMRRARSWLGEDLDAAQQHFGRAPVVKTQVCGPWTLAAAVELRNGERAVRDHGACRDIATALADAVDAHVGDITRRIPSARVIVQVDEPSLPMVLAGGVSTASGLATYRAIDPQVAQGHLALICEAIRSVEATAWLHCCASQPPVEMMRRAGFDIATKATALESLGEALDQGAHVALGVVDPMADIVERVVAVSIATSVTSLLRRWGLAVEAVAEQVVLTPVCGLAGTAPQEVRAIMRSLNEAGRLLRDDVHPDDKERN